ncbi:MAG TPA: DUF1839 family protein [Polyangiaceae bacterium]|nr:DUF1839 family protein [Polyangiaceae bacterium]
MSAVTVLGLDRAKYQPHSFHREDRLWIEKNCYIDVWIEVLHAQSLDPAAMLPFVVALDFDGDQWTFFKPSHSDLYDLYGVDVQELNVWRPLLKHAEEHVSGGRLVFTEADAFFLPDTQGTDYKTQHTKTTIVIETIDVANRTLGYFHNASYHRLEAGDFDGVFGLSLPPDPHRLPFFAEFVRLDRVEKRSADELAARSGVLLRRHMTRRPRTNPFRRFRQRFEKDLQWLQGEGLATYHVYAFATVRQFGANFELASLYMKWLAEHGRVDLGEAAEAFESISGAAKALILKAARAVSAKKAVDFGPTFEGMESAWERGMGILASRYAS